MSKLRPATPEETTLHLGAMKEIRMDGERLKIGLKHGVISKSQFKKGAAHIHNQLFRYITDNKLDIFRGAVYILEEN